VGLGVAKEAISLIGTILKFTEIQLSRRRKHEFFELIKEIAQEENKPDHIKDDARLDYLLEQLALLMLTCKSELLEPATSEKENP
jgi:hypothetical protein